MILRGYLKEISRSQCNADFGLLQCIAYLNEDIGKVIPYLNTELGGYQFTKEPPAVMLKVEGKLIAVHADRIAISNIEDEAEAADILEWLKEKINETWERREQIRPRYEAVARPNVVQILRILGDADCSECGEPSCVSFAVQLAEGIRAPEECLALGERNSEKLKAYLERFDCCLIG